jgi:VWFA-related protein
MAVVLAATTVDAGAQQITPAGPARPGESPAATFRSRVSLVSVSAVVRDKRGKVMSSLKSDDFEVFDEGRRRLILDVHSNANAPASVAILVDGSGSMVLGGAQDYARRISGAVLAGLTAGRDSAALLSFDTRLLTLCEFTRDFEQVRNGLGEVEAFGSTSLYDAIAGSAALVASRTQNRRAVIVLTDGSDNASLYSPERVSWIASTIDVPVYVFAVGDGPVVRDNDDEHPGPLAELARATGGDFFVANTPELITSAVRRVTEELRHQYLIAFDPGSTSGRRRLEVRTPRKPQLRVTARSWYQTDSE